MADGSGVLQANFGGEIVSLRPAGEAAGPSPAAQLRNALDRMGLEAVRVDDIGRPLVEPLARLAPLWEAALAPTTLRSRKTDLRRFAAWCGAKGRRMFASDEDLADLMEGHLEEIARSLSAGSIRRAGSSLTALAEGLGSDKAARGARERRRLAVRAASKSGSARGLRHQKHRLTREQILGFRQAIEEANHPPMRKSRDLAILAVMCDVLARRSEVAGFSLGDLDMEAGTIRIARSKTDQEGKGVTYALSPDTVDVLAEWLAISGLKEIGEDDAGALPLFTGVRVSGKILIGASGRPEHMDGRSIARMLGGHGRAIGISGVAGHTIRRSVARLLYEGGKPEEEIVSLGRWSDIEQMRAYVGLAAPKKGAASFVFDMENGRQGDQETMR